jgi:glycosyltransferase involved in cell wall biosynthesis
MENKKSPPMEPHLLYSILMPTHQLNSYLIDAINSAQGAIGNDNAELIVLINGPNRFTIEAALIEKCTLTKTTLVTIEIPSLPYSLNRGIEISRGQYIARFDSDDICLENRFKHQLEIARKTNADFIFSSAIIIDSHSKKTGEIKFSQSNIAFRCGPIHPAAFIRRDALINLGGYGHIENSEDYFLWLNAKSLGYDFVIDKTPVIKYRIHNNQATSAKKITQTLLTNIGIKVTISLIRRQPLYIIGLGYDVYYLIYIKIKNLLLKYIERFNDRRS